MPLINHNFHAFSMRIILWKYWYFWIIHLSIDHYHIMTPICQAVFCQNLGGDKYVLKYINVAVVFFSLTGGILGVLASVGVFSYSYEYLRCLGQQEALK